MNVLAKEADLPRERIDADYNARASVSPAVFDAAMKAYRSESDVAYRHVASHLDIVYDEESGQTLDLFGVTESVRPVFVFIHGGYWRALSKSDSAFMAGVLARHGIATAVVDYRLAPAVSLGEIVREVRAAVAFLWRSGGRYGIDRDRIVAGGSSAGGHLTGCLLAGGWHDRFAVPENVIKGALPISGIFHLAPIAKSFVQEWIKLDEASIQELSPAVHMPRSGCDIVVAYADSEPDGFKRQSVEYCRMWELAGYKGRLMEIPHRNHFDVLLDLCSESTPLTKALLDLFDGIKRN
jgi:arylformamidase